MPSARLHRSRTPSAGDDDHAAAVAAGRSWSAQDLVKLARDKSKKGRSALAAAIDDLYSGEVGLLTENDRTIMFDILRRLIHDVEASVRGRLAESLAARTDTPKDLILALANDKIEVAYPVLVRSDLLRDEELIEIIQQRAMEHQVAIAMRARVSEPVSDALVETENEEVITTLLSNEGAAISGPTLVRLVDDARRIAGFQQPLVYRRDLSPQLVRKLYWGVSAALRHHLVENFHIDPGEFDEVAETVAHDAAGGEADTAPRKAGSTNPVGPVPADDAHGLVRLLHDGKVFDFLDKFTKLSALRVTLLRRFLFEPGGEGLAITCKALGLDKNCFVTIFMRFRQGRLGDKQVDENELSRALIFFDEIGRDAATVIMRRWQRDTEYQNALRLIEEPGAA